MEKRRDRQNGGRNIYGSGNIEKGLSVRQAR